MNTRVGPFSARDFRKSIRLRSRGPYRRSRWPKCRSRISAERRSQPATMSLLSATATPLLRPRSRSCWDISEIGLWQRRVSTLPENVLQGYTIRYREIADSETWNGGDAGGD